MTVEIQSPTARNPKTAIAIMAHGSRAQAANSEFLCTVDAMRPLLGTTYERVAGIFLELCEPSLMTQADEWAAAGISEIAVYPMFFNRGKHVGRDIPKQIAMVRERYPHITVTQLSYLGSDQRFANFMAGHILGQ